MRIIYYILTFNLVFILSSCTTFKDGVIKTSTSESVSVESNCPVTTVNRFDELKFLSLECMSGCSAEQNSMLNAGWISIRKLLDARYMEDVPIGSKAKMTVRWISKSSFELQYENAAQKFLIDGKSDFSNFSKIETTGQMRVIGKGTEPMQLINFSVIEKRDDKTLIGEYAKLM